MAKNKDGLALVVGGLFILALVFATYNYFNKSQDDQFTPESKVERQTEDSKESTEGDINGNGVSTEAEDMEAGGEIATEETFKVDDEGNVVHQESAFYWAANDYNQGDISGDSYTVVEGDTLWEIAEAVYGNGGDWYKIRDANLDIVGFQTNGQQSLIFSGQALVIPS